MNFVGQHHQLHCAYVQFTSTKDPQQTIKPTSYRQSPSDNKLRILGGRCSTPTLNKKSLGNQETFVFVGFSSQGQEKHTSDKKNLLLLRDVKLHGTNLMQDAKTRFRR